MSDPLPNPPIVQGFWRTIRSGHQLVQMQNDRILDWEPASGHYRIWRYDSSITSGDPLPGLPVVEGSWRTIRTGHVLVNIYGSRVLDWEPASGHYRIWRYDSSITSGDPLPGPPVVEGSWNTIRTGHQLIYLYGNRILDWEPASGHYRIWQYDPSITSGDPLPGPPHAEGSWSTIRAGHKLIPLSGNRVLDWEPFTGHYRIWQYNPSANLNDPFQGPVAEGFWRTIRGINNRGSYIGHTLTFLYPDRILDWVPLTGRYRIYRYDAKATGHVSVRIEGNCQGLADDIRREAAIAFDRLDKEITDGSLRQCIKSRFGSAKIKCEHCSDPTELGSNSRWWFFGWHHSKDIGICVNNISVGEMGDAVIHEWAHSCGWQHGDGKGVPGNNGECC